jgi:hypothetical protein
MIRTVSILNGKWSPTFVDEIPGARPDAASCATQAGFHVYGGLDAEGAALQDHLRISSNGEMLRLDATGHCPPAGGGFYLLNVEEQSRLLLTGDADGQFFRQFFSTEKGEWEALQKYPGVPGLTGHMMFLIDSHQGVVVGGRKRLGAFNQEIIVLDLDDDRSFTLTLLEPRPEVCKRTKCALVGHLVAYLFSKDGWNYVVDLRTRTSSVLQICPVDESVLVLKVAMIWTVGRTAFFLYPICERRQLASMDFPEAEARPDWPRIAEGWEKYALAIREKGGQTKAGINLGFEADFALYH